MEEFDNDHIDVPCVWENLTYVGLLHHNYKEEETQQCLV